MPPTRHPVSRTLEAYGALVVVLMAVVTAFLVVENQSRVREDEQERRLAALARSAMVVLDLVPSLAEPDTLGRSDLRPEAVSALGNLASATRSEDGLSVSLPNGTQLWSVGITLGHGEVIDRRVTSAELELYFEEGRRVVIAPPTTDGLLIVASSPAIRRVLTPLLLRDIGLLVLVGLVVLYSGYRLLDERLLRPLAAAEAVASRVARGELAIEGAAIERIGGGPLTEAIRTMVRELGGLVGAIRTSADEAAALSEEISAATEEMTSSTQEVAGTTQELTDRATRQAGVVRAVAEDAERILTIAQDVAAGALQAAERNAALAALARTHREGLEVSAATLEQLAGEIALGASEAEDLAHAAGEIEQFITQSGTVARQTHILALNAAIEAARAGRRGADSPWWPTRCAVWRRRRVRRPLRPVTPCAVSWRGCTGPATGCSGWGRVARRSAGPPRRR
jgi:methyl-accepting chemotaxis protein